MSSGPGDQLAGLPGLRRSTIHSQGKQIPGWWQHTAEQCNFCSWFVSTDIVTLSWSTYWSQIARYCSKELTFVLYFFLCFPYTCLTVATRTFCVGAENEPDGAPDDWMRIAELQSRNRACLPHLKSSYPVESEVKEEAWTHPHPNRHTVVHIWVQKHEVWDTIVASHQKGVCRARGNKAEIFPAPLKLCYITLQYLSLSYEFLKLPSLSIPLDGL